MRKLPIWLALFCLTLAGCGDMELRNILADIVAHAPNGTLIPITMVSIGVGDTPSFFMGDGTYGPIPIVNETISSSYNMSKYEITHAVFAEFIADGGYATQSHWTTNGWAWKGSRTQPGSWTDSNFNGSNQPVVGVSWYEAAAFCNWRSINEGLTPAYNSFGQATLSANGYRLPTEVEWEYAAAKGASGQTERLWAYTSGEIPPFVPAFVVCSVPPAGASKTADVGSKSTAGDTSQGLADMSGNVWEWCSDNFQADGSVVSGTDRYYFVNDSPGQAFLQRGGAWGNASEDFFRCASRYGEGPGGGDWFLGFRVVRR